MLSNIPFPSLFVCFLIFIAWMHFEKRKATKKQEQNSKAFWQREEEANHARNKDISNLPLFQPEEGRIPLSPTGDENITYYQEKVRSSLKLPMMNLSGFSNTDLKLAYGVGNFKTLSDYDENFNVFLMNMSNLGAAFSEAERYADAITVFQLCIEYGSDKSTDYRSLAGLYQITGTPAQIDKLIEQVQQSELPRKSTIVESLSEIRNNPPK